MAEIARSGKKALSERALRELRARILTGELAPDQHLSETAAAELIGISRTPTREAMAQLVEEGLLARTPTGRCTVRAFTRADIIDAIEIRGVMEGLVLRVAAERGAAPEPLAACRELIGAIDETLSVGAADIDFDEYAARNARLHNHLARLSGSPTLERELRRAHRLPLASPNAFLQSQMDVPAIRESLYIAQAQHKALLEAVEGREGARAEALAREHARLARTNLDYVMFEDRSLLEKVPGLSLVSGADASSPADPQNRKGRSS